MKNFGKAWAVLITVLVVLLLLGLAMAIWYVSGYNRAVRLEEGAKTAWSDVETTLQRRFDLVPNLVETVKGYAKHEEKLFESLYKSREKYFEANKAGNRAGQIEAANQLSGLLSRLMVLVENYPDLKASQNFLALQDQLEGTENRIAVARRNYNAAAKVLNSYSREVFGSFFCGRAGVKPVEYFEAGEEAKTKVPEVKF